MSSSSSLSLLGGLIQFPCYLPHHLQLLAHPLALVDTLTLVICSLIASQLVKLKLLTFILGVVLLGVALDRGKFCTEFCSWRPEFWPLVGVEKCRFSEVRVQGESSFLLSLAFAESLVTFRSPVVGRFHCTCILYPPLAGSYNYIILLTWDLAQPFQEVLYKFVYKPAEGIARVRNLIPDASKYGQLYLDDGTSPAHSIYARTQPYPPAISRVKMSCSQQTTPMLRHQTCTVRDESDVG